MSLKNKNSSRFESLDNAKWQFSGTERPEKSLYPFGCPFKRD